jgi:hypothetical protein
MNILYISAVAMVSPRCRCRFDGAYFRFVWTVLHWFIKRADGLYRLEPKVCDVQINCWMPIFATTSGLNDGSEVLCLHASSDATPNQHIMNYETINRRWKFDRVYCRLIFVIQMSWICLYWLGLIQSQCGSVELTAGMLIEEYLHNNQSELVQSSWEVNDIS